MEDNSIDITESSSGCLKPESLPLALDPCPTGVLIDFSNKESSSPLSNNAEYDDTFGLFDDKAPQEGEKDTPALPPPPPPPPPKSKSDKGSKSHWSNLQPPPLIPPPTEDSEGGDSSLNSTSSPFGLGLGIKKPKRVKGIKGQKKGKMGTPLAATLSTEKRVVDPFSPIFNTSSSFTATGNKASNCGGNTTPTRSQCQDPPTAELVICEDQRSLSPKRQCSRPGSSTPVKRNSVGPNLSDSDSLLDIANLSGFSCSDSDGLLEELVDKLKLPDDDCGAGGDCKKLTKGDKTPPKEDASRRRNSISMDCIAENGEDQFKLRTAVVNGSRRNCDKVFEVQATESIIREKKRRDSVNSKLQRLSMLMSSPIPSPPSPNNEQTGKYIPTPITTPASRRPQSFHSWTPRSSVSTMTSPSRKPRPDVTRSSPEAHDAKKLPPASPITLFSTPAPKRPQSAHAKTPRSSMPATTTPLFKPLSNIRPSTPKVQCAKRIPMASPITSFTTPATRRSQSFHSWTPRSAMSMTASASRREPLVPKAQSVKNIPSASPAPVPATAAASKENRPKILTSALPRFAFGYKKK